VKTDLLGALITNGLFVELNSMTQGADKAIIPCIWPKDLQIGFDEIVIFMLATPTVAHSFSFFKTGVLQAAVSVTASGNWWRTRSAFALKGQTDYVSVRHDTNAQDGDESVSHVDEGTRIWAGLIGARIL